MNEEERKRFMSHVRQISVEKLTGHTKRNPSTPQHINCRSSIDPLPPKMQLTGNPSDNSWAFEMFDHKHQPGRDRNTVVSWESLESVIGARSVAAIRGMAQ